MGVGLRRRAEREIAAKTIECLLAAGYAVTVFDSRASRDPDAILAAMMTTDEDYLLVEEPGNPPLKRIGWVRFIYGNDGWDVINDYTTNLENVLAPANALAESMQ